MRLPWPSNPSPVSFGEKLRSALTALVAIFLAGTLGAQFIDGGGLRALLASMGASAVILFAIPSSPMARSWPLVGGHFISASIGILCARHVEALWWSGALAVGLSIFAMQLTRCLHPPGGASALIPVLGGEPIRQLGFQFLLTPLALNVAVLLLLSQLQHRLMAGGKAPAPVVQTRDVPSLERLGLRGEDLRAALKDLNAFVDIGEDELADIYNRAAGHAYRREFGEVTCRMIMSRDLVTAEFGDDLESVWGLMQTRRIKALPVIDKGRHVLGIITLSDFFRHACVDRPANLGARLYQLIRPTPTVESCKPEVAGQIMSSPVITGRCDWHIAELAPVLSERGIHQVPIVDERGKLEGLVTQSDLIAALYRNLPDHTKRPGKIHP